MYLAITNGTSNIVLNNDTLPVAAGLYGAIYFPADSGEVQVTETIRQVFNGTVTDFRATYNDIIKLLREAQERFNGNKRIPALYLIHNPVGGLLGAYMSEITGGRVGISDDKDLRQISGVTYTSGEFPIFLERYNYFEDVNEVALATNWGIVNGNTLPYNYVTLGTPVGNLPAPIRIEIKNTSGAIVEAEDFYINVDTFTGLTVGEHLLAGGSQSWGSALTDGSIIHMIDIPDAVLVKCAGADMSILAGFSAVATDIYMRAALYTFRDGLYLQSIRGKEVYTGGRELMNLGSLPIPASGYATGSSSVKLAILGRSSSAGASTLEFIQIMPAAGMVNLYYNDFDMQPNATINDDGTVSYYQESGNKFDTVYRIGGPLVIWPERVNRLTVLMDEGGTFNKARTFSISAWYRPRRRTI